MKKISLTLILIGLWISTANAENDVGFGYVNIYLTEPQTIENGGVALSLGVKERIFDIIYGKLGYELDWCLVSHATSSGYIGNSVYSHGFSLGLGLPLSLGNNMEIILEAGEIYSIWNLEYTYSPVEQRTLSGNNFIPYIRLGYHFNIYGGVEIEYRLGNMKNIPISLSVSLSIKLNQGGKP